MIFALRRSISCAPLVVFGHAGSVNQPCWTLTAVSVSMSLIALTEQILSVVEAIIDLFSLSFPPSSHACRLPHARIILSSCFYSQNYSHSQAGIMVGVACLGVGGPYIIIFRDKPSALLANHLPKKHKHAYANPTKKQSRTEEVSRSRRCGPKLFKTDI